jgi:PPM family protein phosphatase
MRNKIYEKSLIATATITNKSENQDCKGEFLSNDFNALFIADGLGSYKYAKQSSERVIDFFVNEAKNHQGKIIDINFSKVYKQAKQKLIDFAKVSIKEEEKQEENLFGTTLISVLETEDKIKISYTGNGAIWHIRGNFNEFPSSYLFPWSAVNILNPHTIPENGKEALYRLISNNDDFTECIPSVIELEKDNEYGDIIMICTDGIYSGDQLKAGKNDKVTWVKYEPSMLKFFEYVSYYFKSNTLYDKESIEQIVIQYLEEIKPMLDDDATIGILISKKTLNYQNEINWEKNERDSGN